jgi:tetratricopeptide (TPR) repeat protein
VREHDRHFYIVPDLLAAPAVTNLRVIADDYYAIVPEGTDPASSELRRAYLQYVIDPLIPRFNKDIAARREPIRQLLKEREQTGTTVSPDVFLTVSRSLVAAADARFDELVKLEALSLATRSKLANAKDEASRATVATEAQAAITAIHDDTVANLADEYERGSVLAFFFADQLQGIETTGFDTANFFPDMIASFDPARESHRPAEYAAARARALAARQARMAKRNELAPMASSGEAPKAAALVKALAEVEDVLRQKDYNGAESRLRAMLQEYPGEPRIFFALAQTWSVAAADATDEEVQAQRLNNALTNYRLAVQAASAETDRALLSRAHEAMGRIHEFLGHRDEAVKEFDEAIKIDEVPGGAYKQALEGRKRLTTPD